MSETSSGLADTNDWDLVYAICYADVNRSILKAWNEAGTKLPKTFNLKGTIEDKPASIDGTFDPWRLVTGGGGSNLKLALPISAVNVVVQALRKKVTLQNLTAVIQVSLDFVPPDLPAKTPTTPTTSPTPSKSPESPAKSTPPTAPSRLMHLRVSTAPNTVTDPEITANDGSTIDDFVRAALEELLKQWLDENLREFTYVFHTVDLPEQLAQADDPSLAWLAPTSMAYACAEPAAINGVPTATESNSVFGILVMTEGRINLNPVQQVSPNAIPAGAGAALLVSKERFLTRFLLGSVHTLFKSATRADFMVTLDGETITNRTDQPFDDMTVQDDGGNDKTVSPDIKARNFTVNFKASTLQIGMTDFHYQYSPGINVYTNYTTDVDIDVDAFGILQMNVLNNGASKGMITTSGAILKEEIVGPIVLSMALGLAGGALGGLADAARALKAGAQVAGDIAVAGGELAAKEAVDAGAQAAVDAGEKGLMQDAAGEIEVTLGVGSKIAGAARTVGGLLCRNAYKILGSMLGAGAGAAIAEIPKFLENAANEDAQMTPSLAPFLGAVAAGMQWPDGAVNPKVVSAQFNGCLQLGVDPGFRF